MPTYVYRRADGSTFEAVQRITDEPFALCPETGQPVERVISGAGLVFKGSGFYLTDYVHNKNGGDKKSEKSGKDTASDTKDASKSETKKVAPATAD